MAKKKRRETRVSSDLARLIIGYDIKGATDHECFLIDQLMDCINQWEWRNAAKAEAESKSGGS